MRVETRVRKGKRYVSASALSEYSVAHGQSSEDRAVREDGYVIALAASTMLDRTLAEKIVRQRDEDAGLEPDDRETYRFVLGRGDYYYRPREIWARLCEMWAACHMAHPSIAFEPFEWYTQRAAYWSATDFEILEPLVAQALHWRLDQFGFVEMEQRDAMQDAHEDAIRELGGRLPL